MKQTCVTLLKRHLQLLQQCSFGCNLQRCQNHKFSTFAKFLYNGQNIFYGMLLYFFAADRRKCLTNPGKKQAQVVINFGCCTYGRPWITRYDFLLDSYGRWQSCYKIAFRLLHSAKELSSIS